MGNLSTELLLCLLIASAIKQPPAPPAGNEPNETPAGTPGSSGKGGGKLIGKITEAAITKVTEESFDTLKNFLQSLLSKQAKLLVAGYITYWASTLAVNIDRLLDIAQLVCLFTLTWIGVLIYLAVKPKPKSRRSKSRP